jgi:hypothetical protein
MRRVKTRIPDTIRAWTLTRARFIFKEAKGLRVRGVLAAALLPLSFGLFPILFLFAQNTAELTIPELLPSVVPVIVFTLLGVPLAGFLAKSIRKGSLIAAMLLFSFFSYGHVLRVLPVFLGTGHLLLLVWSALLILGTVRILRSRGGLERLRGILTTVGAALVLFQVARAGFILGTRSAPRTEDRPPSSALAAEERPPDIYYIVVDGYARDDVLKEIYGVDNSGFIEFLKAKGFYVAGDAASNYCQTIFSLSSILNMDYINSSTTDKVPVAMALRYNRVMKLLSEAGYTTVAFSTGFTDTELRNADVYLEPTGAMSEFENVLLSTTALPISLSEDDSLVARHRRRVTYILDKLPRVTEAGSPKFVFAHIVCPHPPFVFDELGRQVVQREVFDMSDGSHYLFAQGGSLANYLSGYSGQVKYLTGLLEIMIGKVLENYPGRKPILILQADHGPGSGLYWESLEKTNIRERFAILNAYYLPGHEGDPEYASISPVNMFRTLFNVYFGAEYPLLPARSCFATWSHPFDFHDVTAVR